jgi:multiple antibiotic resistance protein
VEKFLRAFIPLFVAIDALGVLPIYVGLTEGMDRWTRRRVVDVACFTAATVTVLFMFLGNLTFSFLGVTTDDFRIAGGVLLLVFAIQDLIIGGKPRRRTSPTLAVVPLGMPLIAGPGVLTTSLLVVQQQGTWSALSALAANLLILYLILRSSDAILRVVGPSVTAAAAKIASLFLAAIGVMMLRLGLEQTIKNFLDHAKP